MKADKLFEELEEVSRQLGYKIRKERGSFRGDSCVVEGEKLIMINKNHPIEFNVGMLARFLNTKDLQDLYIKPVVRRELDKYEKREQQRGA